MTANNAGKAILQVYPRAIEISYKDDPSPLTDADRSSNNIIVSDLSDAKFGQCPNS